MHDPFEWWYSAAEIARRLGKHPRTIKRLAQAGKLAGGVVVCGELHFPWSSVARLLGVPLSDPPASHGFRARSRGELMRKVALNHKGVSHA